VERTLIGYTRTGTPVYVIAGGSEPAPPAAPPAGEPAQPTPTQTFTQEQVSAIAAREKAEGRTAAEKALLEKLGVDSMDAVEALVKAQREADDKQKSEAQRAQEAAEQAKKDAEKARSQAVNESHAAKVERALLVGGAKLDRLSQAAKLVDVEVGADEATVKAAIEKLKTDLPEFFGQAAPPAAPNSDPGGKPPAPKPNEDAYQRGLSRGLGAGSREYAFKGLDR
jgi:acyl carrier protein